jgi:NtrC-family two-component system sensor histidine kinase KinB
LPLVPTDAPLLERVLDNLIGNALKYTNGDGQITLAARRQGGQVIISVADNGEGIPLAYQPHIFDKFVQVIDEDGQPIRKGTGLGLTFCRLVIEAHQGHIWVESQPEQGSTFYFTLPIQP